MLIVSLVRIGRFVGKNSKDVKNKAHLLRVILSSSANRNAVLSIFKAYSWEFKSCKICLFQWLNQTEMAKVKAVRQRCVELNDSVKGATNGLKPYVAISGSLMSRSSTGRLQIVKDQPSAAATQQKQAPIVRSQKRRRKDSCDSLAAVVAAANFAAPSRISQTETSTINALVNMRLRKDQLRAVDVYKAGNYFFRSFSVCMDATDSNHSLLQKKFVHYMIDDCNKYAAHLCTDDRKRILQ